MNRKRIYLLTHAQWTTPGDTTSSIVAAANAPELLKRHAHEEMDRLGLEWKEVPKGALFAEAKQLIGGESFMIRPIDYLEWA